MLTTTFSSYSDTQSIYLVSSSRYSTSKSSTDKIRHLESSLFLTREANSSTCKVLVRFEELNQIEHQNENVVLTKSSCPRMKKIYILAVFLFLDITTSVPPHLAYQLNTHMRGIKYTNKPNGTGKRVVFSKQYQDSKKQSRSGSPLLANSSKVKNYSKILTKRRATKKGKQVKQKLADLHASAIVNTVCRAIIIEQKKRKLWFSRKELKKT